MSDRLISAPDSSVSTSCSTTSMDTSAAVFTRTGKHNFGYDPTGSEEFDWLEYRVSATSGIGGLYCTSCYTVVIKEASQGLSFI